MLDVMSLAECHIGHLAIMKPFHSRDDRGLAGRDVVLVMPTDWRAAAPLVRKKAGPKGDKPARPAVLYR